MTQVVRLREPLILIAKKIFKIADSSHIYELSGQASDSLITCGLL